MHLLLRFILVGFLKKQPGAQREEGDYIDWIKGRFSKLNFQEVQQTSKRKGGSIFLREIRLPPRSQGGWIENQGYSCKSTKGLADILMTRMNEDRKREEEQTA